MSDAGAPAARLGPLTSLEYAGHLLVRAIGQAHQARRLLLGLATILLLAMLGTGPLCVPNDGRQPVGPRLPYPLMSGYGDAFWRSFGLVAMPVVDLARSLVAPFTPLQSMRDLVARLTMLVLHVVVLCVLGGAITRLAALSLAQRARPGIVGVLRFLARRAPALVGTPFAPLIGLGVLGGIAAAFGLLFRLPAPVGPIVGSAFAIIPLLLAIPMVLLAAGQAMGWPLMVATVAIDGEDSFDALSRSYSYVFQRFVRFVVLVAMAWVIAALMMMVVAVAVSLVLGMARATLSLTAPGNELEGLRMRPGAFSETGMRILDFWVQGVHALALGWVYSAFWSAVAAIYLLLRRDVDGAPIYEVRESDGGRSGNSISVPASTEGVVATEATA